MKKDPKLFFNLGSFYYICIVKLIKLIVMSYNVSTMPSKFTLAKRIENLKKSMGNCFVDANIKTNDQGDRFYVEVITTLRPSLKMFEACDTIMIYFAIINITEFCRKYCIKNCKCNNKPWKKFKRSCNI